MKKARQINHFNLSEKSDGLFVLIKVLKSV